MSPFDKKWRFWAVGIAIFAVAFAVRVGLAHQFVGLGSPPDFEAQPDQLDYELLAWRMSEGRGYTLEDGAPTARRLPGTSLALLPVYAVAGRNFMLGRLWFCLLSAATCLVVAWIGREAFGPVTGLVAAGWLAVYPNHAHTALHFVSEAPFGFLTAVSAALTLRAFRDVENYSGWCAAGVSWGVTALVRPNILLVLPLLWLMPLVRGRGEGRALLATRLGLLTAITCAVLLPWVARNQLVMGKAMLSTVNAPTFWGAHNSRTLSQKPGGWIRTSDLVDEDHPLTGGEIERSDAMWRYSEEFLRENFKSLPYLETMKMYRLMSPFEETDNKVVYWVFSAAWLIAAVFMILGLWFAARINGVAFYVLVCPLIAMVGTALIYYGAGRFRDSVAPLYLLFSALGLVVGAQRLIGPRVWRRREVVTDQGA